MFSDQVIKDILQGWEQHAVGVPSPNPNVLRNLLTLVFFASLSREEDKEIRVRLIATNPLPSEHSSAGPSRIAACFPEPEEVTVEWLRKIAPAFDVQSSAIAVYPSLGGDEKFRAWGVVSTLGGSTRLPFVRDPGYTVLPPGLSLTATGPGSILLSYENWYIGRFTAGKFTVARVGPFTRSRSPLGQHLLRALRRHEAHLALNKEAYAGRTDYFYYWLYLDLLKLLIREAAKRSHGATIVWLPNDAAEAASGLFEKKFELSGLPNVHDHLHAYISRRNKFQRDQIPAPQNVQAPRPARDYYDVRSSVSTIDNHLTKATHQILLLAQLACIDGALVIDEHFKPLAFGARLAGNAWTGSVVEGPTLGKAAGENVDLSRYGTRHSSAVAFAGACEGSIVFVISQDGPIRTVFRHDENTIYWWPETLFNLYLSDVPDV